MIKRAEKNQYRKRILEYNYLKYIDCVNVSERNKEIVIQHVEGKSYKELSEKYGVSIKRIPQIISQFTTKAYWLDKN